MILISTMPKGLMHQILAPNRAQARRLAAALIDEGFHARATTGRNDRHVVLAIAPTPVVNATCRRVSFEAGLL